MTLNHQSNHHSLSRERNGTQSQQKYLQLHCYVIRFNIGMAPFNSEKETNLYDDVVILPEDVPVVANRSNLTRLSHLAVKKRLTLMAMF